MQTATAKIRTQVTMFISYERKHSTTDPDIRYTRALNKFPDFWGSFIDSTHMKLYSPSK